MKRPTTASLKKVTPENLVGLGAQRLAEILASVADVRPDLKRALRMELAAEQGADHLAPEIDRRLVSLETSRGKISWRLRPAFVRDLDVLRTLIVVRLAGLDRGAAIVRLWAFMGVARRVMARTRDKDGSLAGVFAQAAADLGRLLSEMDADRAASDLIDACAEAPALWLEWAPTVLGELSPTFAAKALRELSNRDGAVIGWMPLARLLADAAQDPSAYQATYSHQELQKPGLAAQVAQRLLAAGRIEEAVALLQGARAGKADAHDFDWESAWIDALQQSGAEAEAQAARWSSFERTLSPSRARDFIKRLADFDDVEAETRAFAYATAHSDVARALRFLIEWPALGEAARMIEARRDDIDVPADAAEPWAEKLIGRYPAAANLLLRKAAATAFGRRDFKTCDRLTAEADAIGL